MMTCVHSLSCYTFGTSENPSVSHISNIHLSFYFPALTRHLSNHSWIWMFTYILNLMIWNPWMDNSCVHPLTISRCINDSGILRMSLSLQIKNGQSSYHVLYVKMDDLLCCRCVVNIYAMDCKRAAGTNRPSTGWALSWLLAHDSNQSSADGVLWLWSVCRFSGRFAPGANYPAAGSRVEYITSGQTCRPHSWIRSYLSYWNFRDLVTMKDLSGK